jgi:hypothetical protein
VAAIRAASPRSGLDLRQALLILLPQMEAVGVQLGINVALQGELLQRFSVAALQSGLNSDGNVRFL